PGETAVLSGTVAVRGYVSNPALGGYTLEYSSGGSPQVWNLIISSATGYAVEGAALAAWNTSGLPNGVYTLKLTVLPVSGYDSTARLTVRINSVPAAPAGLLAADVPGDGGNRLGLTWNASAGAAEYRVYRAVSGAFSLISSATTAAYIDAAAVTGTTYTYVVRAFDGYVESAGSGQASAFSVNDTGDNLAPGAITGLSAVPGSLGGAISLSWAAPGNDGNLGTASDYLIRYTTASDYDWSNFDGASLFASTRAVQGPVGTQETYGLAGLLGGVTYYFAVKTADFVPNLGPLSNIATSWAAVDTAPPLSPSGLAVADTLGDEGGSLTLTWTLSPDDNAGGDVYGYRIYRRRQNTSYISSAPYASVQAGMKIYIDTSAPQNLRFYYSVAAFDSTNSSPLSGEGYGVSVDNWRFLDAAQGVSLRLADGARVDIPDAGASQNDGIMMLKVDPATYQPQFAARSNTGANPTSVVYEVRFKNTATKLLKNAALSLPYTSADVAGMEIENLRLYTLSGGNWLLLNSSKVDSQAKKVSAEVSHFSFFRIMEYLPSGALLNGDEVYTYPNPAKGDNVTFKFKLSDKSYVKIDVYNAAGEQVASLEKANCPAGQTSEIVWSVKNTASGIYIYRVRAESASGNKAIIKKLAVIH
ncbi:MAG: T9SS type A sorting domain-containing protein, partial [Elusimicrobiota bacterium]